MHCNEVVPKKEGDIERGKSIRRNLGRNPIVKPSAFGTSSFFSFLVNGSFLHPGVSKCGARPMHSFFCG